MVCRYFVLLRDPEWRLAPGVTLVTWSPAAIYPPSVPPEGGRVDQEEQLLASGFGVLF